MTKKVLLIEDENALSEIIAESLATENFIVECVDNGITALSRLRNHSFHIIIIDVMLPGMDGFSIVKKMREADQVTPVIFLTSKTMPHDVVKGFESGGNDYLKKPFSMEELVIRLKVLLTNNRMITHGVAETFSIGRYRFDAVRQQLTIYDKKILLTARENEVLLMLCTQNKVLVEKQKMLKTIWGSDNFFHARTLDVFITRLRRYLKDDPDIQIINLRGLGYKLVW
jgi:DNA-binding response OmpR family regulator